MLQGNLKNKNLKNCQTTQGFSSPTVTQKSPFWLDCSSLGAIGMHYAHLGLALGLKLGLWFGFGLGLVLALGVGLALVFSET